MRFLTDKHKGWARVWEIIRAKYGDVACLNNGETWQYMGTTIDTHQFRHRDLAGVHGVPWVYYEICEVAGDFDPIEAPRPTYPDQLPSGTHQKWVDAKNAQQDQAPAPESKFDFDAYNGINKKQPWQDRLRQYVSSQLTKRQP